MLDSTVRFIDLFAGIGGIRTGLSLALEEAGYTPQCVLTSEIKPYAVKVLQDNYPQENMVGVVVPVIKAVATRLINAINSANE